MARRLNLPKQLYFGTEGNMIPVPQPAFNADFSREGWAASETTLQGGAWVRRSKASHKVYEMSWDLTSRDALRPIMDFAEGVYGNGRMYFLDPLAMDKNVMPQNWGTPAQACYDGPIHIGSKRPVIVNTVTNTLRYPIESAQYTLTGEEGREVFIPNIPGHTIWIGAHGWTLDTAAVQVSENEGAWQNLPMLAVTTEVRCNRSYTHNSGIQVGS